MRSAAEAARWSQDITTTDRGHYTFFQAAFWQKHLWKFFAELK